MLAIDTMCSIQQLSLPCPLCCHPNFSSVDSLRTSLVNVTNRPLLCPICNDIQIGLDKLTIHLFSHSMQQQSLEIVATSSESLSPSPSSMYLKVETDNVDPLIPKVEDSTPMPIESKSTDSLKMVRRRRSKGINNQNVNQIELSYTTSQPSLPNIINAIEQYQCYICGYLFRTRELQRMHLQLVHEIFVTSSNPENNTLNDDAANIANRFNCDYCSKYFKNKGSLRLHLRMVHGVFGMAAKAAINQKSSVSMETKLEDLNKIKSITSIGSINKDNGLDVSPDTGCDNNANIDSKNWECDVCNKSFTTKYFLKKHKRLHTGKSMIVYYLINHR